MNARRLATAALIGSVLAGCAPAPTAGGADPGGTSLLTFEPLTPTSPTTRTAPVSAACSTAVDDMIDAYAALPDTATDDELNAVELPPLSACSSAAEWTAAAQANPAALGLTGPQFIDPELELRIRCDEYLPQHRASTVCQDAIATGLVP